VNAPVITAIDTAAIKVVGPCLLVRIDAGDESGIGECYPSAPVGAIDRIVRAMAEHLLGRDPRQVHLLHETLRRWHLFTGAQGGAVLTALSGIEMALWDLAGRLQGVPVHGLLGGRFRDRVPLYADCHAGTVDAAGHHPDPSRIPDPNTTEGRAVFADAVSVAMERGFRAVKFDVDDVFGALHHDDWNRALTRAQIERMHRQVGLLRELLDDDVALAIDMHARFDVPSAIRAAQALAEFDLMWLEEPVPPENIAALAAVRRRTTVPICAGENLYGRHAFLELFRAEAVDIVMPDLAKFGGLAEGRRVAELAELHYLPFAPHNVSGPIGTVAAAHVCATAPNATYLEYHALDLPYFEDLVDYAAGPVVKDGVVVMTEAPGLGLTLRIDVAQEHRHESSGLPFFESPVRS
jgi:galactonate dehydratase